MLDDLTLGGDLKAFLSFFFENDFEFEVQLEFDPFL